MKSIKLKDVTDLLNYSPTTGLIKWNKGRQGARKDLVAGTVSHGYILINVSGHGTFAAHRLAWLFTHGRMPAHHIDHINGNRKDNRISNLRECTNAENHWNTRKKSTNTSGVKGVSFHKGAGKYCAEVWMNGKKNYLGLFVGLEDAAEAVARFRINNHGEFANLG